VSTTEKDARRFEGERGFALIQMVIVVALAVIIGAFSIIGIRAARSTTRLNSSARAFAQACERARIDAIRRRTTNHVEFTDSDKYEITMDYSGGGTATTRSFTLDPGVVITNDSGVTLTFPNDDPPSTDFDWRGRTYDCNALFNFKNDRSDKLIVQVAGSGDISVNSSVNTLPTVTYSNVNSTSDINPSATLTGNDNKMNLSPCGTSSSVPSTGSCTNCTQTCTGGSVTPSVNYISDLKRNGGNTRTVTLTTTASGTISVSSDSSSNLSVSPSAAQVISSSSGGSVTYTIRSTTKSTGTFALKFNYSTCSNLSVTINVKVTK
jgi:Tfp pilus assembly protein FimT